MSRSSLSLKIALVVERDEQISCPDGREEALESDLRMSLRVEITPARATVDSLARKAIDLRLVPEDERFPDVIVAEIGMLIVGGIDVCNICFELGRCLSCIETVRLARAVTGFRQDVRHAQMEIVEGA